MAALKQQKLSWELSILETMLYTAISHPEPSDAVAISNKQSRTTLENDIIHLLDIIANCFCTGEQGDVVATTFINFRKPGFSLIIAKNSPPTQGDRTAAEKILEAAKRDDDEKGNKFLATVINHSGKNILKRIKKLSECLNGAKFQELEADLTRYTPAAASLKDEFPNVRNENDIIEAFGLSRTESHALQAKKALRTALDQIKHYAHHFGTLTNFNNPIGDNEVNTLRYLDGRCHIFVNSKFMKTRVSSDYTERLTRRFNKVLQNIGGVEQARTIFRKTGEHPTVQWVTDIQGYVHPPNSPEVQMAESFEAALEAVLNADGITPADIKAMDGLAELERKWKKGRVTPRFHCELNLVKALEHIYNTQSVQAKGYVIGCSKRSCLSCFLWMNAFNSQHNTKFMTSGCHGKPYAAWALPGDSVIDDRVCHDIHRRVVTTVDKKLPNKGRQSDEYASGGSDWEHLTHNDNLNIKLNPV